MAELRMNFYRPEDDNGYTDGTVEEYMYGMLVDSIPYDEASLPEEYRWPILYHMSDLRHNIINWYPFEEGAKVLEIGSGWGALTGILCQKAEMVVSVELTEQRAKINYQRHKDINNLYIYPGNLNNMSFDTRFDYVILCGVLEYAGAFTKSANPYVDFLKNIAGFLKNNGKLLIAIENRLGARYFSGAREDHLGTCFSGITGYSPDTIVNTFSQKELVNLLTQAGYPFSKFYYPFPDYKFPESIYTDEAFGMIPLRYNINPLDTNRAVLFDEVSFLVSNKKEAGIFANSFFVEASLTQIKLECELLYAKCSTNRSAEFQIITKIVKDGDTVLVEKHAAKETGSLHVKNMEASYQASLKKEGIPLLKGMYMNGSYQYPYKENNSYTEVLNEFLKQDNWDGFVSITNHLYEDLSKDTFESDSYHNDDFSKYFGSDKIQQAMTCTSFANLDLTFDNLLLIDEQYVAIDYEWMINLDVPVLFILWYALHDYYRYSSIIQKRLQYDNFMSIWGISPQFSACFISWRIYFINHYVKARSLDGYWKANIEVDVTDLLSQISSSAITSFVYLDTGLGYSENLKLEKRLISSGGKYSALFELPEIEGAYTSMRFDPIKIFPCKIVLLNCNTNAVSYNVKAIRGQTLLPNFYLFNEDHPMFEITGDLSGCRYIEVEFLLFYDEQFSAQQSSYIRFIENSLEDMYTNSKQMQETLLLYLKERGTIKEQYENIMDLYYALTESNCEQEQKIDLISEEKYEAEMRYKQLLLQNEQLQGALDKLIYYQKESDKAYQMIESLYNRTFMRRLSFFFYKVKKRLFP